MSAREATRAAFFPFTAAKAAPFAAFGAAMALPPEALPASPGWPTTSVLPASRPLIVIVTFAIGFLRLQPQL
ncbi:MAG: hypothetical protein DRJ42_23340 [Deltaproteobacteria bacterium]|nr:MAG: hypothetical protein DRJ42_23340 [Deltaproteobacteria bacterium]